MTGSPRSRFINGVTTLAAAIGLPVADRVKTDIVEKYRAELQKQGAEPEMKRERGAQITEWPFALPADVTSRRITFYSDGRTLRMRQAATAALPHQLIDYVCAEAF
jgi:hypothetical protein